MRCLVPNFMLPKKIKYDKTLKDLKKMKIELENVIIK